METTHADKACSQFFQFKFKVASIAAFICTLYGVHADPTSGVAIWTNRYNGPSSEDDISYAAATDTNGNVYVTGRSFHTSDYEFGTIAYSSSGAPLWTNRYGPGSARAIATDKNGGVFVAGETTRSGTLDYAVIKYSTAGVPLWTNRYDGPAHDSDSASSLAVDQSGNVFVFGESADTPSAPDWVPDLVTIKYSGAGAALWTNRFNVPGVHAWAKGIAIGNSGNVYVVGHWESASVPHSVVIGYSNSGVPLWTNSYPGYSGGIAVDSQEHVVATMTSWMTIAHSSNGVPLWTNQYQTPGTSQAVDIGVDGKCNVYVAGYSEALGYITVKYSNAGIPIWTNYFGGAGTWWAQAVAVDPGGIAYVTGIAPNASNPNRLDISTIAYSSSGALLWTNRYQGPVSDSWPYAITLDNSGNPIVTGYSSGIATGYDYTTLKYLGPPNTLEYELVDNKLILSWAKTNFTLQTAPYVQGVYTNLPGATSPYTNLLSGDQQYFRLESK